MRMLRKRFPFYSRTLKLIHVFNCVHYLSIRPNLTYYRCATSELISLLASSLLALGTSIRVNHLPFMISCDVKIC